MKNIAFLEYCFIFDPSATFGNIYDFENVLGEVFNVKGYNAEVIDAVKGYNGRRVIFITKKEDMLDDPKMAGKTVPQPPKGKKVTL